MTRKEELKQVAHTAVRAMVADGVKLDGGQHRVSEYHVYQALQQVEREVLKRIDTYYSHQIHHDMDECPDRFIKWVRAQQKELG